MPDPRLPLEGIVVVAIEQAVAAPFCTVRLADAGARVIKIERPEGDFARGYDEAASGLSSYFVWLNRGKDSCVVDLATAEGKAELGAIIEKSDVLVQNLRPGVLAKLGFSLAALRTKYPALITCSISGYGDAGPYTDRKAYDLLIQAESGLSSITGPPEAPGRVGISIVDVATGATAYSAVLEALIARSRTGKGTDIQVSMFDVMADWLTVPLLHQEAGHPPKRMGLAHPSIAPYGIFLTADRKQILMAVQSDREWRQFCTGVADSPSAATDPRFATNVERVKNRAETDALVAGVLASLRESTARDKLSQADIAFSSLNDMAALSSHPHLRRITVETSVGPVSYPAPAPIFDAQQRIYGGVPAIGESRKQAPS